jgi:C4-dicarboxylate transporter DctQ subunit
VKFLDRLEEWVIAFLMGAATLLIFVAVLQRYAAGIAIPGMQDALLKIDLSWAQELCIYMFVWMAKFGAAYGVRTGIHVGVDVLINRLPGAVHKAYVLFGLAAGATFTGIVGHAGRDVHLGHRAYQLDFSGSRDSEVDRLSCASRSGSYLMCFRFLQVAVTSRGPARCRITTSPGSRASSRQRTSIPYNLPDNLHPADAEEGARK